MRRAWAVGLAMVWWLSGCGGGAGTPGGDGGSGSGGDGTGGTAGQSATSDLTLSAEGLAGRDSVVQANGVTARLAAGSTVLADDGQALPQGAKLAVTVGPATEAPSGLTGLASVQVAIDSGGAAATAVFGAAETASRQSSAGGLELTYDGVGQSLTVGGEMMLFSPAEASTGRRASDWSGWTHLSSAEIATLGTTFRLGATGTYLIAVRDRPSAVVVPPSEGYELRLATPKAIDRVKLIEPSTAEVLACHSFGLGETGPVVVGPPEELFYLWLDRGAAGDTLHVVSAFANRPVARVAYTDDSRALEDRMDGPYRWSGGAPGALVNDPYGDCSLLMAGWATFYGSGDLGGFADYKRLLVEPLRTAYGRGAVKLDGFRKGSMGGWWGAVAVHSTDCRATLSGNLPEAPSIRGEERWIDARFEQTATIQERIDRARDGDVIVVAPGTYAENLNFRGKRITVRSEAPDNPEQVAQTIIDGGAGTAVTFNQGEGAGTLLDGFTIQAPGLEFDHQSVVHLDGTSPTVSRCQFASPRSPAVGVLVAQSTGARLRSNTFRGHRWRAVMISGGSGVEIRGNTFTGQEVDGSVSAFLDRTDSCVVAENRLADNGETCFWVAGGSGLEFTDNVITGNRLTAEAPVWLSGCAKARLLRNQFKQNQSVGHSAGLIVHTATETTIEGNTFADNAGSGGAGLVISSGTGSVVRDNIFSKNVGDQDDWGGGANIDDPRCQVIGNTFAANVAAHGGGLLVESKAGGSAGGIIVRDNQFTSNQAFKRGGGMAVVGYGTDRQVAVYDNTFDGNQAPQGGGVYLESSFVATDRLGALWTLRHVPPGVEPGNTYRNNSVKDVWFQFAPDERRHRVGRPPAR